MHPTFSKQDWLTIDLQKLISDGTRTLKVSGEKVVLELPITFFTEAGDKALENSIAQESLVTILGRLEEIYSIQAEFAGFQSSDKIFISFSLDPSNHFDNFQTRGIPFFHLIDPLEKFLSTHDTQETLTSSTSSDEMSWVDGFRHLSRIKYLTENNHSLKNIFSDKEFKDLLQKAIHFASRIKDVQAQGAALQVMDVPIPEPKLPTGANKFHRSIQKFAIFIHYNS